MAENDVFDQSFQGLTYHRIFRDILTRVMDLKKDYPELNQMRLDEDSCQHCDFVYEYHVERKAVPGKGEMEAAVPEPQPDGVYLWIKFLTDEEAARSQQARLYQRLGRMNVLVKVIPGKRGSNLVHEVGDAVSAESVLLNRGIIPKPEEVSKITVDPSSSLEERKYFSVRDVPPPSKIVLHALAAYYPTTWDKASRTYSMVGFFETGAMELKDGRSLKWKWNMGGVLRLDSPDGRDICLVPNDPQLPIH